MCRYSQSFKVFLCGTVVRNFDTSKLQHRGKEVMLPNRNKVYNVGKSLFPPSRSENGTPGKKLLRFWNKINSLAKSLAALRIKPKYLRMTSRSYKKTQNGRTHRLKGLLI